MATPHPYSYTYIIEINITSVIYVFIHLFTVHVKEECCGVRGGRGQRTTFGSPLLHAVGSWDGT